MKTRGPQSITITSFMGCNVCLSHGQLFQEDVDTVVVVVNTKLKLGPQTQNYIKYPLSSTLGKTAGPKSSTNLSTSSSMKVVSSNSAVWSTPTLEM